jgi:hypothetical protein
VALLLAAVFANSALAQPAIITQPTGGQTAVGETFGFSVQAVGTGTLSYQWTYNGNTIPAQTNNTLLLTNIVVTQAGTYAVVVGDSVSAIASTNAVLLVVTQPRSLNVGAITGGSQAQVEVQLRANGRENAVTFSLAYMTNIVANPVFTPAFPLATTTTDTSLAAQGLVGLTMQLAAGQTFSNGPVTLGQFTFDFVTGTNPYAGGFYITNAPTDLMALDTNGLVLTLPATLLPSVKLLGPPVLNRQSGLFEQQAILGNGGPTPMATAQVFVYGLGFDSLTNAITLFNAQGYLSFDWNETGVAVSLPFVQVANLTNGEYRPLTLEYYVPDHVTVPTPGLLTLSSNAFTFVPPAGSAVAVTRALFTNGVFLIEFNTILNRHYYVQYADTPGDLVNNATVQTAFPFVNGTGSRVQWTDNGPPKTASLPTNGSRFYRVLLQQLTPP